MIRAVPLTLDFGATLLKIPFLRATFLLAAPVLFAVTGNAQQPLPIPPAPGSQPETPIATLKIATKIVGVSAVVLDKRNEPVKGLSKDDFILKEDGKEQPIRYFSQDSELPLTLALMVDTSESQKAFLGDETDASRKFFKVMLTRPEDRAVLVQFDTNVLQLQKMTTNAEALENSLAFLSMPHAAGYSSGRGGTLLYDAIVAASKVVLGKEKGRRAMVILTDGDDHGSHFDLDEAIAAAQRADIVVYSVLYSMAESGFAGGGYGGRGGGGWGGGGGQSGKDVLNALSKATGGRVFTVTNKMPLDLIYSQIADDMRLEYQIGYTPPPSPPGTYHKIELKPKEKHLTVEARAGYYSPK
jgi:Ca-activated chloride channel family protein